MIGLATALLAEDEPVVLIIGNAVALRAPVAAEGAVSPMRTNLRFAHLSLPLPDVSLG